MNNSSVIILDNNASNYKQVIKYLESLDNGNNSEQTIEKPKQDKSKRKYITNKLSIDMTPELAIKFDKVVEEEHTKRTPLVRKILEEYCNYYFENESNIKKNNSLVWSNPREQ